MAKKAKRQASQAKAGALPALNGTTSKGESEGRLKVMKAGKWLANSA